MIENNNSKFLIKLFSKKFFLGEGLGVGVGGILGGILG